MLMPKRERQSTLAEPAVGRMLAAHVPTVLLVVVVLAVAAVRVRAGRSPGFALHLALGIGLGTYNIGAIIGVPRPTLSGELVAQLSATVTILWVIGLAAGVVLNDWRQRWLIATGLLPVWAISLFANFWYSRYLLVGFPPLIIAAVFGWQSLARRTHRFRRLVEVTVLATVLCIVLPQSARLIFEPATAHWSPLDRFQYIEGWGSGYGYPDAARFLRDAPNVPHTIFTFDAHSPAQLRTYLPPQWPTRVVYAMYGEDGRLLKSPTQRLENLLDHTPAWVVIAPQVLSENLDAMFGAAGRDRLRLRQVAQFAKPGSRAHVAIYEATRREP